MGIELASIILNSQKSTEERLYQAVVIQAFEDCLYNSGGKNEAYNKKEAHDWFVDNSEDFQQVCWLGGFDPDNVRERYLKLLKEKKIYFSDVQLYWLEYKQAYADYREADDKETRRDVKKRILKVRKKLCLK